MKVPNDKVNYLLKTSFVGDDLDNKIQWIWSRESSQESKVEKLSKTCEDKLDLLYQCESKNGANHSDCLPLLELYKSCLSKSICPKEVILKDIFCFGENNNKQQQSLPPSAIEFKNVIKVPPSTILNQINENEKSDYCREFSNQLSSCLNNSLTKIWSSN